MSEKRVGLVGVLFMALALVLGIALASWAQETAGVSIGQVCFRMLSFDDTIKLNVVQFSVPAETPGFFTFGLHWEGRAPDGRLVYALDGGGSAVFNPEAEVFTLDLVLWNRTNFFGNQRICRLHGATDGTLTGNWSMNCSGLVPPTQGGTPYLVQGTLVLMPCAPDISPLPGEASVSSTARFSVAPQGMLAGEVR